MISDESTGQPYTHTLTAGGESSDTTSPSSAGRWQQLTVADGLMVLVVLLGALVRLIDLGGPPLSPDESEAALAVWQFWQKEAVSVAVASPAYFSLTNLVSPWLGNQDWAMRVVPVFFGIGTVALPWLLRRRWHAAGMLATGLLLALSPLNIMAARTAGGQTVALFALGLLVVSLLRFFDDGRPEWAYMVGGSIGLGFASDQLFISGLVALLPASIWLIWRARSKKPSLDVRTIPWVPMLLTGAITFLVLSTTLLLFPEALGASFRLPADWLAEIALPFTNGLRPIRLLFSYEPALIVLGSSAIVWAVWKRRPLRLFLALWSLTIVVVLLIQAQAVGNILVLTLSGYLLTGLMAGQLLRNRDSQSESLVGGGVAGGVLLGGLVILVSLARLARVNAGSIDQNALLLLATMAFVAAGGVVIMALAYDNSAARWGAFVGLMAILLFIQWGTSRQVSQTTVPDPREPLVTEVTDSDVRRLATTLGQLSAQTAGSDSTIDVFATTDSAVLKWYLKDFDNVAYGATLPHLTNYSAVITAESEQPRFSDDYFGADFGLTKREVVTVPTSGTALDTLRWWLFRESDLPVQKDRVVLWVRSDLGAIE